MCLGIVLSLTLLILEAHCIVFPETCKDSQYYDPDKLTCEYCMVNASLIPSEDGFGCVCDRQSVSEDISKCRKCNSTEIPTRDKTACVPRRCQKDKAGRLACRRCPTGYVSGKPFFYIHTSRYPPISLSLKLYLSMIDCPDGAIGSDPTAALAA
ncbi:hypothetical protein EVAR_83687_1 [Eumeta japonica]|uniref:Uncharacterized protein n=1 Tax=Eumeta variegata TaxID=151549 RepID=A0A4C1Y229_EUMVA|nr:hypothetical protein EVAR_83687_1 [Eumeta japonica]